MEAQRVVEAVQTSAAAEAAHEVASEVAADAAVVLSEVAAVGDELADHAEASEERHEEILEGQQWQQQQFADLRDSLSNSQTQTAGLLSAMQTQLTALQSLVTEAVSQRSQSNLPSQDSTLSNQEPVAAVVVVEEPKEAASEPANQERSTIPPRRKPRLI